MIAAVAWPALLLGTAAALSVGPVFVAIMQTAVTHGFPAGLRVILGSALADAVLLLPVLAFTWIIASLNRAAVWTSLAGAVVLCYLAVQAGREARRLWRGTVAISQGRGWALRKGLLGNLGSPATWSYWLAVGTPTMMRAQRMGGSAGLALFLVLWFLTASGLEAVMAFAVSRTRHRIGPRVLAVFNAGAAVFFAGLAGFLTQHAAGAYLPRP